MFINKKSLVLIVFLLIIIFFPLGFVHAELKPINFSFNVPLPGFPAEFVIDSSVLPNYIIWLYKFVFAVAGLLAVFMITIGGIIWIFAGGNSSKVSQAREYITGAVTGLLLAVFSYSILYIINPALVMNSLPEITMVEKVEFEENIEPDIMSMIPPKNLVKVENINNVVITGAANKYPYLREDTLEAFKKANNCLKSKNIKLQVNYFSRTLDEQQSLYAKNCKNGKCSPPTCNPNSGINSCPHTSGAAVDVVCEGKSSNHDCQNTLQACFLDNGWCRLQSEKWHFEYPLMKKDGKIRGFSSTCSVVSDKAVVSNSTNLAITNSTNEWVGFDYSDDGSKIYYPKNYKNVTPTKLVVFYHGDYISGHTFEKYCNMAKSSVAGVSKDDYVVACVKGSGDFTGGSATTWKNNFQGVIMGYTSALGHYKNTIKISANRIFVAGHSRAYEVLDYLPNQSSITGSVEKYIWLDANYGVRPLNCNVSLTGVATTLSSACNGKIIKKSGSHMDAIGYLGSFLK